LRHPCLFGTRSQGTAGALFGFETCDSSQTPR
jgi:hypothetical protein